MIAPAVVSIDLPAVAGEGRVRLIGPGLEMVARVPGPGLLREIDARTIAGRTSRAEPSFLRWLVEALVIDPSPVEVWRRFESSPEDARPFARELTRIVARSRK